MELVEENQKTPLTFLLLFTTGVVLASELLTRVLMSGQTSITNQFYWLLDRTAGITSYELLALSSILGVSMTSGLWDKHGLRKWAKQLHQYTTLLFVPFLGLHLFGLYQDTSVPFSLPSLLIPFHATYHPLLTALGVLSFYGSLVLISSSYLRKYISMKAWRTIHFLSFPLFLAVTVHGFFGGTDSKTLVGFLLYAIPFGLFVGFTMQRVMVMKGR